LDLVGYILEFNIASAFIVWNWNACILTCFWRNSETKCDDTGWSKSLCAPADHSTIISCTETFWSPCINFLLLPFSNRTNIGRLSSGYFPRRLSIKSRRFGTLCRFHLQQVMKFTTCWRWNQHSVPKRRLLILRHRGNTQKTICHYNNTAKAWKLELTFL
jgi:hypothetical protein